MTNSQQSPPNANAQVDSWSSLDVDPKAGHVLDQAWLRAHQDGAGPSRRPDPLEVLSISSSDEDSVYNPQMDDDSPDSLFKNLERSGHSRPLLGVGKGKQLQMVRDAYADHSNGEEDIKGEDNNETETGESSRSKHLSEGEDDANAISASPIRYEMECPSPANNPFVPETFNHDYDFDFDEDVPEKERNRQRHVNKTVTCAGLSSQISSDEIMWMIEYYNFQGKWYRPRRFMRMHRFNFDGLPCPRMVVTNKLAELGFGWPMHPWLLKLANHYDVAPIQVGPNSWRLAIGIYIVYRRLGFPEPSMLEMDHFLSLRKTGDDYGFFYLTLHPCHHKKGFSVGNPSNMKFWKPDYFYFYDIPRQRVSFNLDPYKPQQTDLEGELLTRAQAVDNLDAAQKKLDEIVTPESLREYGFYNKGFGQVPLIKFDKRNRSKKALECLKKSLASLTGKGKMAELPFGNNPFAGRQVPVSQPRPTISVNATPTPRRNQTPPPEKELRARNKQKRGNEDEVAASKKKPRKGEESTPSVVSVAFSVLAEDNYDAVDVKVWSSKKADEAEHGFKLGLGEAFFQGLNVLAAKNAHIAELEKANTKLKSEATTSANRLKDLQKKYKDDIKTRDAQIRNVQDTLNELTESSTSAANLANSTIAGLQYELEGEKASKSKELSDAYRLGFSEYLINFLAADPDYDWTTFFAPSTPAFMVGFKEANATAIEKARKDLEAKILSEKEAFAKKGGETTQGEAGDKGDGEATTTE
ncbi:uncharacterized protein LOC135148312 isoform X2 [Daucus carota subsp. sativus]